MTASAAKSMVINSRERAVSSDINRLQQFIAWQSAEIAKRLLAYSTDDYAMGDTVLSLSTGAPLKSVMWGGMCRPQEGSTDVFIDPSVTWCVFPDAVPNPDDSPLKLVVDPGNTTPGALVMTVGHATLDRWDVLEATPVLVVDETSSRDIYDPASGLFAPATVTKVTRLKWQYRIRTGTAGAGFPGTVSGYLPLMVFVVPALAANWNAVGDIYDVRPLMSDYASHAGELQENRSRIRRASMNWRDAKFQAADFVEGIHKGRIVGGIQPLGTTQYFGGSPNANRVYDPTLLGLLTGAGVGANIWMHLYALFPYGLPRWALYKPYSIGIPRVPMGFRGILVWSQVAPNADSNQPGGFVTLPAGLKFGGATVNDGMRLAVAHVSGTTPANFAQIDDLIHFSYTSAHLNSTASVLGSSVNWNCALTPETVVPTGAREMGFEFYVEWSTGAGGSADGDQYSVDWGVYDGVSQFIGQKARREWGKLGAAGDDAVTSVNDWLPVLKSPPGAPIVQVNLNSFATFTVAVATGKYRITGVRI